MINIGYFSLNDLTSTQEKLLEEKNHLNIWWSRDASMTTDNSGILYKNPNSSFTIMNGKVENVIKASDLIVVDYSHPVSLSKQIYTLCKKHKKPVVGANLEEFILLEEDRKYANTLISDRLPLSEKVVHTFSSKEACLNFIRNSSSLPVLKTLNSKKTKYTTFIPMCIEDAVAFVEIDPWFFFKHGGGVLVERYIEGTEICLGFYFDGNNIVEDTILVNQEYKCSLEGNQGRILTGEVGTVSCLNKRGKLPSKMLSIVDEIQNLLTDNSVFKTKYRGFVDVNLMYSNGDFSFLEFTMRPGIPTEVQTLNMVSSYTSLLGSCAGYQDMDYTKSNFDTENIYVSGCLTAYGIPYNLPKNYCDMLIKINGLENLKNPYRRLNSNYDSNGNVVHNLWDRLLLVHGKATTFEQAKEQYISEASKLSSWHSHIRMDIGCNWKDLSNY